MARCLRPGDRLGAGGCGATGGLTSVRASDSSVFSCSTAANSGAAGKGLRTPEGSNNAGTRGWMVSAEPVLRTARFVRKSLMPLPFPDRLGAARDSTREYRLHASHKPTPKREHRPESVWPTLRFPSKRNDDVKSCAPPLAARASDAIEYPPAGRLPQCGVPRLPPLRPATGRGSCLATAAHRQDAPFEQHSRCIPRPGSAAIAAMSRLFGGLSRRAYLPMSPRLLLPSR